jgi:release factor glutamine methyltransferase
MVSPWDGKPGQAARPILCTEGRRGKRPHGLAPALTGYLERVLLARLPGVFPPHSDSWMLAAAVRAQPLPPGARALDVCTGTGLSAVSAALAGALEVTAVDASRRAVACARLNARLNGVRVRVLRGDLLAPVAGERFHLITSNPPYVPGLEDELPTRGAARAWDAGLRGRALLDPLCAALPAHLRPGGVALIVHSAVAGLDDTVAALRAGGLEVDVVAREVGGLGLLAGRRAVLEERGLLRPRQDSEEVYVVRGRRARTT